MLLRANSVRALLAASLLLAAAGACKKNVKPDRVDPDANSGPDATRGGAKPMAINRPETDRVSGPRQMSTKWKRIELTRPAEQPILSCELHIDSSAANLNIDIYDALGSSLAASPAQALNKVKTLNVPIPSLGTYFVRIQAPPKDESDFSVICNWEEKQEQAVAQNTQQQVETPKVETRPTHEHGETTHHREHESREAHEPKEPREHKPRSGGSESIEERLQRGTEGRIVQNYRVGDGMVLYLDKGASAGVKVGTEGQILDGKSGLTPLDGGQLTVTQVDDTKSIAKSKVRSLGRNFRIVLFVK